MSKTQKSFLTEEEIANFGSEGNQDESEDEEEEGEGGGDEASVELSTKNLSQVIHAGQAFPHATSLPYERGWWGYQQVVKPRISKVRRQGKQALKRV
jgi:hypothetical protein